MLILHILFIERKAALLMPDILPHMDIPAIVICSLHHLLRFQHILRLAGIRIGHPAVFQKEIHHLAVRPAAIFLFFC